MTSSCWPRKSSTAAATVSGDAETRCMSLKAWIASMSPSGMNKLVKNCRCAGRSLPQPWRIRVSMVSDCSGENGYLAKDPYNTMWLTRSGWFTAKVMAIGPPAEIPCSATFS